MTTKMKMEVTLHLGYSTTTGVIAIHRAVNALDPYLLQDEPWVDVMQEHLHNRIREHCEERGYSLLGGRWELRTEPDR